MICVLGSDFPHLGSQMPQVGESRASITFIFTESQEAKFVLGTHLLLLQAYSSHVRKTTLTRFLPPNKIKNTIVLKRFSCLIETKGISKTYQKLDIKFLNMSRSGGQKERTVVSQLTQCQPQKISQNGCEVPTHESLNWRPIRYKKHPSICVGFSVRFVFLSMINNSTQFSAIPGQQEAVIYHQEESPWQSGPVFLLVRQRLSGNLCSLFLYGGEISRVYGPSDNHIISLMCKFEDCPMLTKHHLLICSLAPAQ